MCVYKGGEHCWRRSSEVFWSCTYPQEHNTLSALQQRAHSWSGPRHTKYRWSICVLFIFIYVYTHITSKWNVLLIWRKNNDSIANTNTAVFTQCIRHNGAFDFCVCVCVSPQACLWTSSDVRVCWDWILPPAAGCSTRTTSCWFPWHR